MAMAGAAGEDAVEVSSTTPLVAPFPVEVFECVFLHLSPVELAKVAQTSRALRDIVRSSTLWERTYLAFWREEHVQRGHERGTIQWREARRHSDLWLTARDAWRKGNFARTTLTNDTSAQASTASSLEVNKKSRGQDSDVPFPKYLSAPSRQTPNSADNASQATPRFYELFKERLAIDQAILDVLREQCIRPSAWLECIDRLATEYGSDCKDVMHALVCVQQRAPSAPFDEVIAEDDFPTAFQLRLPNTRRSASHHLTLLHLGRELLEHLQCRQAMKGLVAMRPGSNLAAPPLAWTAICPAFDDSSTNEDEEHGGDVVAKAAAVALAEDELAALRAAELTKQFENGLCWLSMFRGGEGQEVAGELDVLAISCALYLAQSDVQLTRNPSIFAQGICAFMQNRGFRGAVDSDFHNLDNNFLHLCLDESSRDSLPLTLVVIFCSLAARLGLRAYPTNTPGKIMAVVQGTAASAADYPGSSKDERFWINVFDGGQLYEKGQLRGMFGSRFGIPEDSIVGQSSPATCCVRAAKNIIASVQRAQVLPTLSATAGELGDGSAVRGEGRRSSEGNTASNRPDQSFEVAMLAPDNLFNPRRTYLHPVERNIHLVSPFWSLDSVEGASAMQGASRLRAWAAQYHRTDHSVGTQRRFLATPGRFQRMRHWSEHTQHAAMHASSNALIRLGDELGERGLEWSMGLVRAFFPLDILVLHEELLGIPATQQQQQRRDAGMQVDEENRDGAAEDLEDDRATQRSPLFIHDPERRKYVTQTRDFLLAEDRNGPAPKRRTPADAPPAGVVMSPSLDIVHPVGSMFVHRMYRYRAVIVGWDQRCDASEEWMINMGVDALPNGGRNQPFFHSLVEDGSTRYVAHCNVQLAHRADEEGVDASKTGAAQAAAHGDLRFTRAQVENLLKVRGIGRLFRCASSERDKGQLRLIRNARGHLAFPDDGESEADELEAMGELNVKDK